MEEVHQHGARSRGVSDLLSTYLLDLARRPMPPEADEVWGVIALLSAHCDEARGLEGKLWAAWKQDYEPSRLRV